MSAAGSVLVDTNIVVAHFRGDPSLLIRLTSAPAIWLPWVVLGELHFGAQRAKRRREQLALISGLLAATVVVLPDLETTVTYAQVKSELAAEGKPIPDNDLWIAAVARQHQVPLATRDAHFANILGLTTLAW